jgi:low affinity Fe/Cu permease
VASETKHTSAERGSHVWRCLCHDRKQTVARESGAQRSKLDSLIRKQELDRQSLVVLQSKQKELLERKAYIETRRATLEARKNSTTQAQHDARTMQQELEQKKQEVADEQQAIRYEMV